MDTDIICLSEHNLSTDQFKTRQSLQSIVQKHIPAARTITTTSPIKFSSQFKPGGCITILTRTIHGRITSQQQDELGRWTVVSLATKRSNLVYIITAYKPCKATLAQAGPLTVLRQQWTILRNKGIRNPNPRKQFDIDLTKMIASIMEKGHQVILFGDFNETKDQSDLFQSLYNLGLRDMVDNRHRNLPKFRSYARGNQVIDYGLCSLSLLPLINLSTYEPFRTNTNSDHRGIIVDFNSKLLFGKQHLLSTPTTRGLQSTNIIQSEKFLQFLSKYWKAYNIDKRIDQATNPKQTKQQLRILLNEIDDDITQAILKAEKKTKLRERPPWSPELKEASLKVKYFKLILRKLTTNIDQSIAIQNTLSRMHKTEKLPSPVNRTECQVHLRKAQKKLRQIRKQAQEKRTQYLDMLISKYELTGQQEKQAIINRIRKAEATKRCYRKLRWILNPPKPGVTFVQRTKTNGETETLYDRTNIEQAILLRNQKHFNQCTGTPFTVGPLRKLNWAADTTLADSILNGTCDIPSITSDKTLQFVLNQCQRLHEETTPSITTSQLASLFLKWRESTTTSPSGRHIGLYKTIFNKDTDDKTKAIANNIAKIVNTLLQNGMGLDRWRRVVNMMIHKIDGIFLLDKLRVIHIFEADYNGTIGILFNRTILYAAEQNNLINNNQWGCRPHRQAQDALLLKELTYNLSCTTKTTLATFDNDATGCFDRVPCTIAMLASRRLGAHKNMCRLQADTLRHIQHQLKTAYGLSNVTYHSSDIVEIHGQGQGSRAGPPTWVFVSSLLLDCMQKLTTGVTFTCPQQELTHHRHNDAFVDDVTGYTNHFIHELRGEQVLQKVIHTMQHDAITWNNLLHISGGKLAIHKCLYYVLTWKWSDGQAIPVPPSNISPPIYLPSNAGNIPINHLDCNTAHRTLGQMKSPLGNQYAQLQRMTNKSNTWLAAIQESALSRTEAQAAYEAIWFPSLSYGLGTTNLTHQELDTIQKPIIHYILPKLGYNRHFPRAVVFGSPQFGGLNFKSLYIEQGTQHIMLLLKHYRYNNSIGQLLRISIRWLWLIAGFSFCPLRRPQKTYHHITDRWFRTTIHFLYECKASLELDERPNVLSRENDSCLMEDFLLFAPTKTTLLRLNRCRLFLRVTTLSDLTSIDGKHIMRNCWDGSAPVPSPLLWPRQESPSPKAWQTWRFYLAQCYLPDDQNRHIRRTDLRLRSPLGRWLHLHRHLQIRDTYINPLTLTVYKRHHQIFDIFRPTLHTRTQIRMNQNGQTTYLPKYTHPIPITLLDSTTIAVPKSSIIADYSTANTPPHKAASFEDYLLHLPLWEAQLLQNHAPKSPSMSTATTLTNHPIIIASDGSEAQGKGSCGWVISSMSGDVIAQGAGTAFGSKISSFRCEAYGILAATRFILRLRYYYHLPSHNQPIKWWCDSKSLIQRLHTCTTPRNPNRASLADHDIEFAIHNTIPLITTQFNPHHLHSHQADSAALDQLPIHIRLNRMADKLAQQHNNTLQTPTTVTPLITLARCQLHIRGQTITRSIPRSLQESFTRSTSISHIRQRFRLHHTCIQSIAWTEFQRAFSSFSTGQKRILRRWLYGFLPTQLRLHRYNCHISPKCPMCNSHDETDLHFLECRGTAGWEQYLFDPLERTCRKYHATHWVEHSLRRNIKQLINKHAPTCINPWIQPAFENQQLIGWQNIFYGLLSTTWITRQNHGCQHGPNGSKLITEIIKTIFAAILLRWNERNNHLHQRNSNTTEKHKRVQAQIRALYTFENQVLATDKHIFAIPLHQMLQKPTSTLELFINHNKRIIKESIHHHKQTIMRQHRDIQSYFPPKKHTRVTSGQ